MIFVGGIKNIKKPKEEHPAFFGQPKWRKQGRERVRMLVRYRDKFTCQDCGEIRTPADTERQKNRLFDVHHLNGLCGKLSKSYDREKDMDGLVTLCHRCHFNHPQHSQILQGTWG